MNCTKSEDSVALGNYDIDIHNPKGTGTLKNIADFFINQLTKFIIKYIIKIYKFKEME